jgi:hypothetical protein
MKLLFCQTWPPLEHPFPITSAHYIGMQMTATMKCNFVLPLSDGTTCNLPLCYGASLTYMSVSPHHFTSPVITDHIFNGYCIMYLPGCWHIVLSRSMSKMQCSLICTRAIICTSSRDQVAALPVVLYPASPLTSNVILANQGLRSLVYLSSIAQIYLPS